MSIMVLAILAGVGSCVIAGVIIEWQTRRDRRRVQRRRDARRGYILGGPDS